MKKTSLSREVLEHNFKKLLGEFSVKEMNGARKYDFTSGAIVTVYNNGTVLLQGKPTDKFVYGLNEAIES